MRAEIVSVGTELLMGQTVDTNAAVLGKALTDLGISIYRRTTVGDNHDRLLSALKSALQDNDIVFTIGGLGPTMDDITRDVLAEAFGDTLVKDEDVAHRLAAFFRSRGVPLLESNLRQAMVPTRGRAISNPNGTAPGLLFEDKGKIGIALPGPPNEFKPMLQNEVVPLLRQKTGGLTVIRSRVLRICNMGESMVEDKVRDLMMSDNPSVAPYAKTGEVHLRVSAKADSPEAAEGLIEERVALIAARLGSNIYAHDDEALEAAVVRILSDRNLTVATAESCTGGLVAMRITEVAGSSKVYLGGAVTYSNASKTDLVGVPEKLIESYGAVSEEVAAAMATGVRERFGADFGISITGVAGPDGGSEEKPVGTVYIGLATDCGVDVVKNRFIGIRQDVRTRSSQVALTMLRDASLKFDSEIA